MGMTAILALPAVAGQGHSLELAKPTRTATDNSRADKSSRFNTDKPFHRTGFTDHLPAPSTISPFRGGGRNFSRARAFYGPIKVTRERPACLAALVKFCQSAKSRAAADSDYPFLLNIPWLPFDTVVYEFTPAISTLPLVEAAKRKEATLLVKVAPSDDCLQLDTPVSFAPAPAAVSSEAPRQWLSISTTPGLSNMINLKETAEALAAARKAGSPFLIDPSRVRPGSKVQ